MEAEIKSPIILKINYDLKEKEKQLIYAATDFGSIFIDGLADGVWISNPNFEADYLNQLMLNILQASRSRITKTDYISCPSCGRTLFNIQEATAVIRAKTDHLKGLKIGVMGCIVNGPGEMADADYGYVGAGKGKITLYKKKEVMKRSIPEEDAVEELIKLIKENGDWVAREE
jgi:(E)-4-hydroxy-3-methylbut-2-enyl-diphosphate synthase